ncbi:MAG TPA: nitrous oxide reductase accessory protein NosL [Hanamia sp.]|nr:nitrous oxide reductase accessory protein NosL [Hanamia sp.]
MKKSILPIFVVLLFGMISCNNGPQPIKTGEEACAYCKMTISQLNFGGEIITKKGKIYKFDDLHCLAAFRHENMDSNDIKSIYFLNFSEPHNFIDAHNVFLLKSNELHSPMGGNTAAFDSKEKLNLTRQKVEGNEITVQQLFNNNK